jgi:membrane-bound serine protease (ClpP class)
MRTVITISAVVLLLCAALPADVVKIQVSGAIHAVSDEYIGRALEQAKRDKADAVLIEISTPGGLAETTRTIVEKIIASPVPVIVYVAPSGSRAASAGFFILQAADVAAMAPGTNTGAAHPVMLTGGKMDDVMKQKVENDAAAFMRAFVAKRGRNVAAAESAVRESKSFTDQEALADKLIDVVASNESELLRKLDGRTITRFNGDKVTLRLAGKTVHQLPMTLKQRILAFIMDPNIAFILLTVGLLALYAEFNHPGAVVPGVVGLIFILLAIFAFNLLPTRFAAIVLILAAFVLFALEAKFTSHGALGMGGVVLMTVGALLLVDSPIPEMRVRLVTALAVSIPVGLITVFLVGLVLKARRNKVVTGEQGMVGEIAVARTPLSPTGQVFVHGEIWNAVSSSPVAVGQQVQVRSVDGLTLQVEPVRKEALSH